MDDGAGHRAPMVPVDARAALIRGSTPPTRGVDARRTPRAAGPSAARGGARPTRSASGCARLQTAAVEAGSDASAPRRAGSGGATPSEPVDVRATIEPRRRQAGVGDEASPAGPTTPAPGAASWTAVGVGRDAQRAHLQHDGLALEPGGEGRDPGERPLEALVGLRAARRAGRRSTRPRRTRGWPRAQKAIAAVPTASTPPGAARRPRRRSAGQSHARAAGMIRRLTKSTSYRSVAPPKATSEISGRRRATATMRHRGRRARRAPGRRRRRRTQDGHAPPGRRAAASPAAPRHRLDEEALRQRARVLGRKRDEGEVEPEGRGGCSR